MTTSDLSSLDQPSSGPPSEGYSEGVGEYFYTPALKGLVQQLTHLAFFGDGMSVVVGEKGAGKTSLSHELRRHLDQAYRVINVDLATETELGECVESVSSALGLRCEESASVGEMLAELRSFVQSLARDKKLVVVVVDQAHYLDDQAVGALVSLLQGGTDAQAGLHLILLSDPGLDKRIEALQILDVAVYRFDMPNFSPSELASFLAQRTDQSASLNSSVVQKLWSGSQGVPGVALHLALGKKEKEKGLGQGFSVGVPFGHIAAIALLAAVLLWSLLWRGDDSVVETGPPLPVGVVASRVGDVNGGELSQDAPDKTAESVLPPVVDQHPQPEVVDDYSSDEEGNVADVPARVGSELESGRSNNDYSAEVVNRPGGGGREASIAENTSIGAGAADESEVRDDDSALEVPIEVRDVEALDQVITEVVVDDESVVRLTEAEVFLMAQNSDFYTLQVIAASKRASLDAYIQRQPNKASLYMYRGTREGKSWFVVVQGVYSSREAALLSKRNLPSEQAKAGPWPRKLYAVQEEIEEFRGK